jgi:hypothetical protein
MFKKVCCIISLAILLFSCEDKSVDPAPVDNRDILEKLSSLEGVEVTEIVPQNGSERQFEIYITQPVDHQNPGGAQFRQRIYLSHINENAPMVLSTSGYSASARETRDIVNILQANLIAVPHRYMAGAEPNPIDWQCLNVEQAAADNHLISTLFKQIYTGPWINRGGSKSGLAALFHRRFYPDDVQATLAWVAPILSSETDPRIENYIKEEAGTEECRIKLKQFQRTVLQNRSSIIPLLTTEIDNMGYGYAATVDEILEYLVLEFPFYFWCFGDGNCSTIPDSSATASQLLSKLLSIVDIFEYTEVGNNYYKPVYYQLYTEIGYYRLITEHLQDLLFALPNNPSHKVFAPNNNDITFNPQTMQDLHNWLQTEGNNIIHIYGGQDPWTACAVELTGQNNAVKIIQPGANHFVRITDLDQQQLVLDKLEQWLAIEINQTKKHVLPIYNFKKNIRFFNIEQLY